MQNKFETIEQAKQFLRENMNKGAICPCCHQDVKMYPRKLSASMGYVLLLLVKYRKSSPYFHVSEFLDSIGVGTSERADWQKLVVWKLIERPEGKVRQDGSKRVGEYKVTQRGIDFAENNLKVHAKAKIYNGKDYGFEGKQVSIKDVLGSKFNYDDLMNDTGDDTDNDDAL